MIKWVQSTGGYIPDGAVVVGYEQNGLPLFSARADYAGGVHPGKVRIEFGAANIPYGGNEIKVNPYQVLVGTAKWVAAKDGQIPKGAVVAGREADGTPLYVARAEYACGLHPGKVRPEFGAANIPYGGKEVKVSNYEVLVYDEEADV